MKKGILAIALTGFISILSAQEIKPCGTTEMFNRAIEEMKKDPSLFQKYIEETQNLNAHTKDFKKSENANRGTAFIVPVVFHIIHDFGPENISDEQVRDAVRIINEDFKKMNADTSLVVPAFKDIVGDAQIEFRLAQKDPNGNYTNGIVRVASEETYRGINNMWQGAFLSNLSRWPRESYLNVWVVARIESGAAGYSNYPGVFHFQPLVDGMVMLHNYTGSIGTSSPDRSRTFTHEAGHWLNLMHTWGNSNNPGQESNCDSDDDVEDTPLTIGWRSCNLSGSSCGSHDNVQNFMEYSYCSRMFTAGQSERMQAAITSETAQRNNLWQPSNLELTGTDGEDILFKADFTANVYETCEGRSISFSDNSSNGPVEWDWFFEGGNPENSDLRNPSVSYPNQGVYSISLNASNSSGSKSINKAEIITILPQKGRQMPAIEKFSSVAALPDQNWFVNNPDNGITWEISNVGSDDNHSIFINNMENTNRRKDEIISSTYDLSNMPDINVSFNVAYAQRTSTTNDALNFYISNDCGETWLFRWRRSGVHLASASPTETPFVPNKDEWRNFLFTNIPASYRVENFRFKFEFESQQGNNIYLDDIMIYDPATVNVNDIERNTGFTVFPNPSDDKVNVSFSLPTSSEIKLSLMNVLGKEINLITDKNVQPGQHNLIIDKTKLNLPAGIYFVTLSVGGVVTTKKLILR
jgi:PKD repeat protein